MVCGSMYCVPIILMLFGTIVDFNPNRRSVDDFVVLPLHVVMILRNARVYLVVAMAKLNSRMGGTSSVIKR